MAQTREGGGGSRLQKLLLLLEGGSCEDTRKAAARQIVDITKAHPQQLPAVIHKVHTCLYHKQWDARVAAGDALGLLAEAFPHYTCTELLQAAGGGAGPSQAPSPSITDADKPTSALQHLNIKALLDKGTALLASGGQEYDLAQEPGLTAKQRLEKQKEMLKKRLGLGSLPTGLMDTDDLLNDEDLDMEGPVPTAGSLTAGRNNSSTSAGAPAKQAAAELLAGMEGLSARERNRLKRKAKALNRGDSLRPHESSRGHNPALSRQGSALALASTGSGSLPAVKSSSAELGDAASEAPSTDEEWADVCSGGWPLQWAADQMMVDVLDPCWEVRHGAAMGLRELLRSHAGAAGVQAPVADETSGWMMSGGAGKRRLLPVSVETAQAAQAANRTWLEECVVLLLCVLALDHFADYGSDQVTAPVRETAAQALACAVSPLPPATVLHVISLLEQLQGITHEWAIRYGGYLGVKYLLAARLDLAHALLPRQLPLLTQGLQDYDDDVCAASAAALIPLVPALESQGGSWAEQITDLVWSRLDELDSLSPASASCLQLLSHLYSAQGLCRVSDTLGLLVPRLWPHLHHALTSVRMSTAACLERLLQASKDQGAVNWVSLCVVPLAHLVFCRILVEVDEKVQSAWLRVWTALMDVCPADSLPAAMQLPVLSQHSNGVHAALSAAANLAAPQLSLLQVLFRLASTPAGQHLPSELLPAEPAGSRQVSQPGGVPAVTDAVAAPPLPPGTASTKRARRTRDTAPVAPGSNTTGAAASGHARLHQALHAFVVGSSGEAGAVRMHMLAAQALAALLCRLAAQGAERLAGQQVFEELQSPFATARQLGATSLWYWMGQVEPSQVHAAPGTDTALQELLRKQLAAPNPCHPLVPDSPEPYSEARQYYAQLRRELLALITACMQAGWLLHTPTGVTVEQVSTEHVAAMLTQVPAAAPDSQVALVQQRVGSLTASLQAFEQYLHMTTLATYAAAVVRSAQLPPKLNTLLQPLMAALRKEPQPLLQGMYGQAIAELLLLCKSREPCPNGKLVRNLCSMAWSDPAEVPNAAAAAASSSTGADDIQQPILQSLTSTDAAASGGSGAEASAIVAAAAAAAADASAAAASLPGAQAARIARLGAEIALKAVCQVFGEHLWNAGVENHGLPSLWQLITAPLALAQALAADPAAPVASLQSLIHSIQILKVVGPHVAPALVPTLEAQLPLICTCLASQNAALRAAAARCLAALIQAWMEQLMPPLLRLLVPQLGDVQATVRLGAVEAVAQLAAAVGEKLAPYVVLLVVPLLRCMSDTSSDVRARASSCFGSLVALLPLAHGLPSPAGLDDAQMQSVQKDSVFLIQLLDNKRAEDFQLPVQPRVHLRSYQQEGVNWLAFLRRFGLHGVLADDMGLGKTLQASCIIAAALKEQLQHPAAGSNHNRNLPTACLIVCPSTLVQHWVHEMDRFMDSAVLRPVAYLASPSDRVALQRMLDKQWTAGSDAAPNVVVLSYEHLRADLAWVTSHTWLYCVLDEGHVIKNHKSRIAQACRTVVASHRLILSGTPIQNSVLELWSLFEFLMPGFLGAEKEFNARYGKALKAAKYSKRGSREAEAGLLAVDALHKQVMPFVLRRTKAQVLSDLPPKIVQDIYCDMSALQSALYEDFQGSQASSEAASALQQAAASGSDAPGTTHVFQALHYMRRLCSHPALVVDPSLPQHQQALHKVLRPSETNTPQAVQTALRDIRHAPKLVALRELLVQCGIVPAGGDDADSAGSADEEDALGGAGTGHRLLVFAQAKAMLDLVERDVLAAGGVSFLRLDGSVDASQRFGIVQRFNSDPTIDVLLLTTSVGGLGLNLTSADTVVFLEHDWNPMKDLQAMDRAHRLGQTRAVNVYRLLMRGTLEEKVMGLQQFKLEVANAVVNQDNMSLSDMDTGRLLDLFGNNAAAGKELQAEAKKAAGTGLQAMLAGMGELWDEKEYDSQFNMASFMQKLGNKQAS